jgi:L-alanine-DL-glutamate epimerase-like enolase superfamily enzyme
MTSPSVAPSPRTDASLIQLGSFADAIPIEDRYVVLPDAPGIGVEVRANLWAVMREVAN